MIDYPTIQQFRIWSPKANKYYYSGGTPKMLSSFFDLTAAIHTVAKMRYERDTQLKDKDNKEIYEGDIVRHWYDDGRNDYADKEVYIGNEFGGVTIKKTYKKGKKTETLFFSELWDSEDCEIIGNIHDNKD